MSPAALAPEAIPATAPIAPLSPFAAGWEALTAAGLHALAIHPHAKFPAVAGEYGWSPMTDWQLICDTAQSRPKLESIARGPRCNIGAAMGSPIPGDPDHVVIALDFDVEDLDALHAMLSACPDSPTVKVGSKGETRFFRAGHDIISKSYTSRDHGRLLDVLAHRKQTVLPPSIHPDTRKPYAYKEGKGLVPVADLPVLTRAHMDALEAVMRDHGWDSVADAVNAAGEPRRPRSEDAGEPNIWRATNDAALANPDPWFDKIGLANAKKIGPGRWRAAASFRASTTGKLEGQRKRNVSLHPTGIKDMGTDIGYSPLDLVCTATGCSFDEAFRWLRGRLGLDGDELPDTLPVRPSLPRQLVRAADGTLADAVTGVVVGAANDNPRVADEPFPDALTRPPGVLGEMIQYIVDTAKRPSRALALGSALCVLGTLCGRRDMTPTRSGTHLYVIALAGTGAGKQHPQDAGEAMLEAATSIYELRRYDDCHGPDGVASSSALNTQFKFNPLCCSFMDEFGELIAKINSPKAGNWEASIKTILLQVWGKSFTPYRTLSLASGRGMRIHSVAFSIFGASTPKRFYSALQSDDSDNGFLNRFLLIPEVSRIDAADPLYDFRNVPPDLVKKLQEIYTFERPERVYDDEPRCLDPWSVGDEPHMRFIDWATDSAKDAYDAFGAECQRRGSYWMRSAEMAGRIATIVAVGQDCANAAVTLADIEYGIAVTRWSAQRMEAQAEEFITDTVAGRNRARILAMMREKGGRVKQADVMKNLGFSSKELNELVTDLGPSGTEQITVEEIAPATGGRKCRYLALAGG